MSRKPDIPVAATIASGRSVVPSVSRTASAVTDETPATISEST